MTLTQGPNEAMSFSDVRYYAFAQGLESPCVREDKEKDAEFPKSDLVILGLHAGRNGVPNRSTLSDRKVELCFTHHVCDVNKLSLY